MSTSQQWLELVQGAGALFGSYLQEALASKFARVLPNNVCLLPDDKVKSSLLIVEKISNLLFRSARTSWNTFVSYSVR